MKTIRKEVLVVSFYVLSRYSAGKKNFEKSAKKTKNKKYQSCHLVACRDSDPGLLRYGANSSPRSMGNITMESRQLLCFPNSFDII